MTAAAAVAVAVVFGWLGMVVAISFLEAPLKFRAPGVTLPIGLGIGRLVFAALNRVELALAAVLVAALLLGRPPVPAAVASAAPVVLLLVQLLAVRPRLTRRSERVLAGGARERSRAHLGYVVLEVGKALGLLLAGVLLLGSLLGSP